jgi:hypothetical protein
VADLEIYVGRVWSPEARPLVEEAWRCYNSGVVRASIAATWTAVTADIIAKLIRLAEDGDAEAAKFRKRVNDAQAKGITREGVRAMQTVEDTLLSEAEKFELIDSIGARELERIREDRNLCVHPSLRSQGDVYSPRPEVARGHLAVALTTLLIHPPTQGRKMVEDFTAYVCDPSFIATAPHIQATFFDLARAATRQNLVKVAAKHALFEIAPPLGVSLNPGALADRMAEALNAFAARDRQLIRTVVGDQRSRFQVLDGETQLRALRRLGEHDYFWDMVDAPLKDRLNDLISNVRKPTGVGERLSSETASVLALVCKDQARSRLPALEEQFSRADLYERMAITTAQPDEYFVPFMIKLVKDAGNWQTGSEVGEIVLRHARYLTEESLSELLAEWADNIDCRKANRMPSLAVALYYSTVHLGPSRKAIFADFLERVRAIEGQAGFYSYPDLETAIAANNGG